MRSLPDFLRTTATCVPSMFQRMTTALRPASVLHNRRVLAITATFVLALSLFGGYAAIASSSAKASRWQQLVSRYESLTKILTSKETPSAAPAPRTIGNSAVSVLAPTAVTLSWNTFGNAGTETTEPSTANDPNISSANLTLGAGITPAANTNRFGGSGWFDTGNTAAGNTLAEAIAGNNYIQFVVTPNSGFSVTPTSFVFSWDHSATGPSNVALRSSVDSFAANLGSISGLAASITTGNTITISGLTNLTTATTFRLYGYGATATGGTGGFDTATSVVNVQLNGTTASTAPTITAGGPITRQQGSATSNSTIAMVSDTSAGTLTVTATTVPTGISVANIVNSSGTITADVAAGCTATVGANTVVLTVTNGTTGLTNTANLTVNVDPNTPALLTYNSANVSSGTTGTVNPATGPSDNGSVASIVVQSVSPATTPGTLTVDNTTGVVTVPNNVPAGTYTVTIRATDNCGGANGTTDATFTLTVQTPAPILGNYSATTLGLAASTTVTPSAAPQNTTSLSVATNTNFKGTFAADPATGVVRVTNAHPAGMYTVTVTAFNGSVSAQQTFSLTVQNSPACTASVRFTDAADVGVGVAPQSAAIGDFNGDGKQDLAIANGTSGTVSIRLGDGLGGFSGSTNVSVGSLPLSVALGDFNGDGKQDFAAANRSSNTVSIRLGDGLGGFSGSTNISVGSEPTFVAVGDFNGDGKQDFATANQNANTVSIRLGDGTGGFSGSTDISVGMKPQSVALADFNGDGKQDFAAANQDSNTVSIRLGDGLGGFSGTTNVSVGTGPSFMAIGDFNGDGKQDFAVANVLSNTVSIRLGDGTGSFSAAIAVIVGVGPNSVAVGDFNGDGKQDFATAIGSSGTVSIQLGDGLGGFSGTTSVIARSGARAVAIGDFNSDGRQDFAVVNAGTNNVSIRLGDCDLPPSVTPVGSTLTAGQTISATQIATAADAVDALNTLQLAISSNGTTFGNSATLNGVTVTLTDSNGGATGTNPDALGNVLANIAATCAATNATFKLRVTDSSGNTDTKDFSVTVNAHNLGISLGANPTVFQGTTSASLPYTATTGSPTQYSIDYDTTANTAGFVDVTNATLPSSPIVLVVPGGAGAGTYNAMLTVRDGATGCASSSVPFTVTVLSCPSLFTVNDLGDTGDAAPGNGICADATGKCTLRAAIMEANALAATACSPLTIDFSVSGTINVATALPNINHPNLTISGPGANQLTVSGVDNTHQIFVANSASPINLQISGLTITKGFASTGTNAGAIEFSSASGTLTVTLCVLTDNGGTSNATGQIYSNSSAGIVITGSTISGNPIGRGIIVDRTPLTVTNSTISGNATFGIRVFTGSPAITITLLNSTLANNGSSGVGFNTASGGSATLTTKNSIIANNAGSQIAPGTGVTITSQGNNLCSDASLTPVAAGDLVNTNPLLASLGNYGGSTQTRALLPGSPAINAGTSSGAPTTDQRGSSRFGATDIGAFESQGFTLAISGGNGQSAVVNTAFTNPLSATVMANNASEPVNGGLVTYTSPGSGASASIAGNPATISGGSATSGTVTANSITGTYNVSANANGATAAVNFSLTNTCQTITVTNPVTNTGTAGTAFSRTFTQTGGIGTTTFSTVSTLPTGITLSPAGVLSGTPTQTGSFPITVKATDSNGCMGTGTTYTLTINCQTITVINPGTNSGTAGAAFSQTFTQTGGIGTTTFSTASTLPTGLTLSTSGVLSGTPTQTGSFPIVVKATDSNGCMGTGATYTLTINCQTITVTNPATTSGTEFSPFSQTFTQTGGIGTITFSTASTLPTGLTLSTAGVLSGTPTQTGSFPIVVKATDSNGCMGTGATYNLVINAVSCVASLTVNNLGDGADATPGDSVCETATGNGICTLRAAIEEANAIPDCSPLTINFIVTGTINLATELPWLEHPNLTIQGPGANLLNVSRNVAAAFTIFIVTGDVVTINDLTVSNGDASGTFDVGGGIYNSSQMLTINRCEIASNTANQGGGLMNDGGDVFINNSTIRNNSASSEGAGVYNSANEGNASVTLTNCTISGNTVIGSGGPVTAGGLVNFGAAGGNATASLINCTLTNNETTSSADAGGIFSATDGDPDSRATITLKNTLLAGNASPQAMKAAGGAITSQGNNLDSDGSTGFTNGVGGNIVGTVGTPINPLLASLSNFGGTTRTHALLPGSPAINAGTATGAPITDQRGSARVGATDIGAFESQGFTLTVTSGNSQSAVVNTAFGLPLKVTVTASGSEPVNGGKVTFTPPVSGASATVAGSPVTIASGMATTGTVTANSVTGSYNVAASANGAAAGVNFALTNTCQTITVNNPGTNTGTANAAFSATFTQTGGIGTTTFSTASTLPTGITLAGNGLLSGTPTQTGSFPITVKATDSNNCMGTSVGYTLTINCQTITVTAPGVNTGTTGTPFSQTFTQTGGIGTTNFSTVSALPTGITLSTGGVLSGTPTQSGVFPITVKATDANGCMGTASYTLTINQAPAFTSANTTTLTVNMLGSFTVTTSGFPTVTTITQSGALPSGVTFTDNGNGTATLSGTPAVGSNGNYPLIFTASNGIAPNATQNFTLVVSGLVCPSTLTVNNLGDASDANPGDGLCATSGGVCTLRAAVQEANAITACTPLTINFSVTGVINLATVLPDLNHPNLTINGPGAANLTVTRNSSSPFRIFGISASRTVTITGLKITNGLAAGTNNGGGISNSGTLTLSQCVISGNGIETTSVGGVSFGGGIYSAGPLAIDRCEISGNSGRSGAGIAHNGLSGLPLIITNSTISGNIGVQSGGFDIRNTSASLTNCTISGNSAPGRTGGIDQVAQSGNTSSLSLTNCTVTNNNGSAAIETFGFAGVTSLTTTLKNTLVAGNVGANFSTTLGTLTSLGNNLDSDGTSGFTNGSNGDIVGTGGSPINALLGPLAQNGGPTQTHALLPGSPAIDKGGAGVSTDQRGQSRPFDIPGVANAASGNASDIGAFEVQCAAISLAGLSSGVAGVPYTSGNIASGGTAPYTLNLTGGSLPPGVTISGNGLTGTPTQLGTFNFTLLATDAYGCQNSQSYTVVITCPTITLSPATLPNATINTAYPQTITASPAASYSFAVTSGALPAGLTLNSNGSFSGAPTQGGTFNFRVTATTFGSCSGFQDYILQVNCTTITLAPSSLPGGTIGMAYNQTVSAAPAGSYTFAVSSGALPAGLTLNSATGAITGQPTTAGTFNFTIRAAAGSCFGSQSYTVVIGCQTITFSPTSLPAGTAGTAYSQTLTVTPAGNYTFSLAQGNLPSGLTLNPTTGVISGLPAVTGTVSFIVKVQIPNSCSTTQPYTLTINCPPAVTLAPASLPNGAIGTPYNQTLSAAPAGGNYAYTITNGSLPVGLSLNAGTGVISGTPSVNGTYNFSIVATGFGSCASAPKAYTIVIGGGGCPTITLPSSLPNGAVGTLYSNSVAASPADAYSYAVTAGALPPGLTLFGSFGLIFGYPTAPGTYNFTITATLGSCTGSQSYSVVIGSGVMPAVLQEATVGKRYTQHFNPLGLAAGVNFSIASGKLPEGITLTATGALSGTPSEKGNFLFTLRAADAVNTGLNQVVLKVNDVATPVVSGSIVDPLNCTRSGSAVNVSATVSNTSGATQTATFTAALPAQLLALPGTCSTNVAGFNCSVTNASTVTATGTLANNQSVTITYQAQIADGVQAGAQVCVTSTASFAGAGSASVQACTTLNCPTIGVGSQYPAASLMSDQKAGSVLIYNIYTSATDPTRQNTRLSITNTDTARSISVHLFFVDGSSCSIADSYLCLTQNQTASFLASDLDPGTTGYVVAVATDANGCPTNFNFLIGDEYVKFASGHAANLSAEAIAALPGGLVACNTNSTTAAINFDGISYNTVPRVLAVDNVGSRADGNDTLLILNRIGGNLATGASTLGTVFGILYDDSESGLSFSVTGSCQLRNSLSNNFPRTTPRFENFIPAGRSGWLKVFSQSDIGLSGSVINFNPNAGTTAGAFNQGHNLHTLTNTSAMSYTIPVFPPGC